MPTKEEYWKNPDKYRAKMREYADAHPDWKRESGKLWARKKRAGQSHDERNAANRKMKERDPVGYLLHHARNRAAKLGIPFDLDRADIVVPDVCPVLGLPFEWGRGRMGWRNMRAPSLDRIKPQLGYVRGNVRVISTRANHVKGNATIVEMEAVLFYMKESGANYDLDDQGISVVDPLLVMRPVNFGQLSFGF